MGLRWAQMLFVIDSKLVSYETGADFGTPQIFFVFRLSKNTFGLEQTIKARAVLLALPRTIADLQRGDTFGHWCRWVHSIVSLVSDRTPLVDIAG